MTDAALSPLYERWLIELTGASPPPEPLATCRDCAMLDPPGGLTGFDPSTKCCTYTPLLPNYLVGAALADARLDALGGRETLRRRIESRKGVTPLGLEPGAVTRLVALRAWESFGRSPELRCPHYNVEHGLCGIWLHRNAVCSTWFCKYERGQPGRRYWVALRNLLIVVERTLSLWCVLKLDAPCSLPDPTPMLVEHQTSRDSDPLQDGRREHHDRRWGDWGGREMEFYARCHELARDLRWSEVESIAGPELGLRVRALEQAARSRDEARVPDALVVRHLEVLEDGDPVTVATYSATSPLRIPRRLFDALVTFRGQPVEHARAELSARGVAVDNGLLLKLVDYGVLAAAEPSTRPT